MLNFWVAAVDLRRGRPFGWHLVVLVEPHVEVERRREDRLVVFEELMRERVDTKRGRGCSSEEETCCCLAGSAMAVNRLLDD